MKLLVKVLRSSIAMAGLAAACAVAADRTQHVTLNESPATLKGQIRGYDRVQYSFTAQAHQQLMIKLSTSNPSNYINVRRADMPEAVCQGALTDNDCSVQSDAEASYVVDVYLMRNAARRSERAKYTLVITPGSAAPKGSSPAAL